VFVNAHLLAVVHKILANVSVKVEQCKVFCNYAQLLRQIRLKYGPMANIEER